MSRKCHNLSSHKRRKVEIRDINFNIPVSRQIPIISNARSGNLTPQACFSSEFEVWMSTHRSTPLSFAFFCKNKYRL